MMIQLKEILFRPKSDRPDQLSVSGADISGHLSYFL